MNPHYGYPFVRFTLTAALVFLFVIAPIGGIQAGASGLNLYENPAPGQFLYENNSLLLGNALTYSRFASSFNLTGFRQVLAGIILYAILFSGLASVQGGHPDPPIADGGFAFSASAVGFVRLDTTFNATGVRRDAFGLAANEIAAAAIQPDGKIVIAGTVKVPTGISNLGDQIYGGDLNVKRYNPDGSLDPTFGEGCISKGPIGQTFDITHLRSR